VSHAESEGRPLRYQPLSYAIEFWIDSRKVASASVATSTLIAAFPLCVPRSDSVDGAGRLMATFTMSLVSSRPSDENLPNAIALSSPSPNINVLWTGYGTGNPLEDVACNFGTSTDSFELSVDAAMVFAMLTFRVDTRISRLCERRTREGTDRVLYNGVGVWESASSPNLIAVSVTGSFQ
jgi:hypothetical protein